SPSAAVTTSYPSAVRRVRMMRRLAALSSAIRTRGGVLTEVLARDRDLLRAFPARGMGWLGDSSQIAALVERNREDGLGIRKDRVKVDKRDLGAVLGDRDLEEVVFGECRMDVRVADRQGDFVR